MKSDSKVSKDTRKEKEDNLPEADNFKTDLVKARSMTKERRTAIFLIVVILVIFSSLGVAAYQIFYKKEDVQANTGTQEKIESKPETTEPAAKTPTPAPVATTPAPATPAPTPAPAQTGDTSYTVKSGDSWSSIANANGMTSKTLMDHNGATSESLQIGQVIKIPK